MNTPVQLMSLFVLIPNLIPVIIYQSGSIFHLRRNGRKGRGASYMLLQTYSRLSVFA